MWMCLWSFQFYSNPLYICSLAILQCFCFISWDSWFWLELLILLTPDLQSAYILGMCHSIIHNYHSFLIRTRLVTSSLLFNASASGITCFVHVDLTSWATVFFFPIVQTDWVDLFSVWCNCGNNQCGDFLGFKGLTQFPETTGQVQDC